MSEKTEKNGNKIPIPQHLPVKLPKTNDRSSPGGKASNSVPDVRMYGHTGVPPKKPTKK